MSRGQYREKFRAADGCALEAQVSGSGPALLLLAGQANSHRWWRRVRPDYAERFTTITFDYRGTGASSLGTNELTTRMLAGDALRCLDVLGISTCHVFGTSMGGRVAQWFAADYPRRLRHLVLGCTSPGGANAVERAPDVRRALVADTSESSEILASLMYSPEHRRNDPGPYPTLGDARMSTDARGAHLRASASHDAWDALPGVTAPTLLLHGTDDALAPVINCELLASRIPGVTSRLFTGARHAFFEERRAETVTAVSEFVNR
ncbi:alpha/beta hydrolase [Rhodococcus sp. 06-621-2]|nr:alpha/beta hydrolase [Rhodococcus sp. 06-621-2]OZC55509.1 alpha/beta hydrolase [Rhodococcus sp. 06-621-2]